MVVPYVRDCVTHLYGIALGAFIKAEMFRETRAKAEEKMVLLFYRQLQGSTHGDVVEKFRALVYGAIND